MSKTIRVTKISDSQLKRLEARGFKVTVVGSQSPGELAALERQAARAVKTGDTSKAKSVRLKMLKMIQGGKCE